MRFLGKGMAHVVSRSLVSLELARMMNLFGIELLKVNRHSVYGLPINYNRFLNSER